MQWQQTAKIPLITDGIINLFADSHSICHNDPSLVPVYSRYSNMQHRYKARTNAKKHRGNTLTISLHKQEFSVLNKITTKY